MRTPSTKTIFLPVLSFNVFFWFNALDVDKYAENRDNNMYNDSHI